MIELLLMTLLAGAAIPVGGGLAMVERIRPRWLEDEFRHSVIAFGGGVLLSAVAVVLVPEGMAGVGSLWGIAFFVGGGIAFLGLDALIARHSGSAAQLVAMLADFVPEAIALGAVFSVDRAKGVLLALLITMQNLPEGFNAYRELRAKGSLSVGLLLGFMGALALLGPICGVLGHSLLSEREEIVGGIMLFAAGGILYLTFEDIAPQAQLKEARMPALGAVLGFACGLLGQVIAGGA